MPVERLTIDDMSDREFLLVLHDQRDSDGWTDSEQIRQQLDLAERRIASTRLSWLARWGAVEREVKLDTDGEPVYTRHGKLRYTQRWCLTPAGSALAFGSLKARQQQTLDGVDDTQGVQRGAAGHPAPAILDIAIPEPCADRGRARLADCRVSRSL
jgi:hypothetical protein